MQELSQIEPRRQYFPSNGPPLSLYSGRDETPRDQHLRHRVPEYKRKCLVGRLSRLPAKEGEQRADDRDLDKAGNTNRATQPLHAEANAGSTSGPHDEPLHGGGRRPPYIMRPASTFSMCHRVYVVLLPQIVFSVLGFV